MPGRKSSDLRAPPPTEIRSKPFDSVEFAAALKNVPALLMILSPDLYLTWMNDHIARVFDVDPDTAVGRHWYDLVPMMEMRDDLYQRVVQGEQLDFDCVELPFPNGSRYFAAHYRPIVHAPGSPASVFIIAHEVTAKVLADQLLDEKQTRLDFLNKLVREIRCGSSVDEILGNATAELARHFPTIRVSHAMLRGGRLSIRHSVQPEGMSPLVGLGVDLTTSPGCLGALERHDAIVVPDVTKDPRLAPTAQAVLAAQSRGLLLVPLFDRESLVGCLSLSAPEPHDWTEGEVNVLSEIAEYVSIAIREARSVERQEQLETHLAQRQKLESLGALAGGVAHDFNNILQGIQLQITLAREVAASEGKAAECLEGASGLVRRGKELVDQILLFSRREKVEFRTVCVAKCVRDAVAMMRATLPATIDIRVDIEDGECCVRGNATQIGQVVVNLSTNASYAMRERGGVLEISSRAVEVGAESAMLPQLGEGRFVRVTVRDSGVGMSAETRVRALEPFFTTKPVGEGSGMGLAVVHGIVENHRGAIRIESAKGEGTTVDVFLRACDPEADRVEPSAEPVARGRARLLLVDDEDAVRDSGKALLELRGYQVETAANAVDALALLGTGEFDLVVTDQTMPGMTGMELGQQIVRLLPGLPVILVTGRSEATTFEQAREIGIRRVLKKPVDFEELVRSVEGVLADSPG